MNKWGDIMHEITIANKYITHHRFKGKAMSGRDLNIPYGTQIVNLKIIQPDEESSGQKFEYVLATLGSDLICLPASENGKKHFAINDDGKGLERGKLTYAIAYGDRKRLSANGSYYRFGDDEADMIFRDYDRWIRPDIDVILFNEDFFKADVDELRELAEKLDIHIK